MTCARASRGFGLIEVLVSLVIISLGLLGIAALHSRAQQAEVESYQRTQALVLLSDMSNRIRTNKGAAGCYDLTGAAVGVGQSAPTGCNAYGTIETQTLAVRDINAWHAALIGEAEKVGDVNTPPMIGARGCITANTAMDQFTVTVAWQGLAPTVAPASGCGKDQYGDDDLRRAVSLTVQLADLQP
jgi:type IV pilus assembly protein PilV